MLLYFFSEYPIAYAIDVKDGSESDIMVYRFNGVNHTYILDNDEEVTDDQKADFKNFIETLYKTGDLSILSNDGRSFTVTKAKKILRCIYRSRGCSAQRRMENKDDISSCSKSYYTRK